MKFLKGKVYASLLILVSSTAHNSNPDILYKQQRKKGNSPSLNGHNHYKHEYQQTNTKHTQIYITK